MECPGLLPVFRLVAAVFLGMAALSAAAFADTPNESAAVAAVAAARAGDWSQAYAKASLSQDAVAQKVVRWLDYTRANANGRFPEIASLLEQDAGWPLQKTLRRRAEEALASESDDVAADWFNRHPPISGIGKIRAAEILLHRGKTEEGTAALRQAWIDGDFLVADEHAVAARYAAILRPEDHQKRLDR